MCLIVFAIDVHPRYRLVLAANRDEYFNRPSAQAAFWEDAPQVLAGRDLEAGGTWLGVTDSGRIAAVTTYREHQEQGPPRQSRGKLVADFLTREITSNVHRRQLEREGHLYNGFNLLFGDITDLSYWSNRHASIARIPPGVHGLSNHLLDTPWPKVVAVQEGLARLLRRDAAPDPEDILDLLSSPDPFDDNLLPDTGIGLARERFLSPVFITGTKYGTRSSTVILFDHDGCITMHERSFDNRQRMQGNSVFRIGSAHTKTS